MEWVTTCKNPDELLFWRDKKRDLSLAQRHSRETVKVWEGQVDTKSIFLFVKKGSEGFLSPEIESFNGAKRRLLVRWTDDFLVPCCQKCFQVQKLGNRLILKKKISSFMQKFFSRFESPYYCTSELIFCWSLRQAIPQAHFGLINNFIWLLVQWSILGLPWDFWKLFSLLEPFKASYF